MSEPRGQTEPSMEEILASIRRIISQESQEGRNAAAAAPPAARHSLPAAGGVLLLTEMVAEDGSVVSLADVRAAAARGPAGAPPAAAVQAGADATAPAVLRGAREGGGTLASEAVSNGNTPGHQEVEKPSVTSEIEKKEGLVSRESRAAAAAAFSELTRQVAREREAALDGGRTVEDLVREALQPMLKTWLDTHLPTMVERVVRQEIQRVARQAEEIG